MRMHRRSSNRGSRRRSTRTDDSTPPRIVLVEDNVHYASTLRSNLEIEGFIVDPATNLTDARRLIWTQPPALVLLDVMLPGGSGYDLLHEMRTEGLDVPVVVLTARRDEEDTLRGFGLGADDFIVKPVSLLELLARIRAVLRRVRPGFENYEGQWIRFGDIEVHPGSRTVRRAGAVVDLRPKEFDLLIALVMRHDRVVSRAELLRDVWGYHTSAVSRTIDTHIAGLRQKLERNPLHPAHFVTVRSAGYMLRM
jgi:DNA-binding response OmpR family regulator